MEGWKTALTVIAAVGADLVIPGAFEFVLWAASKGADRGSGDSANGRCGPAFPG
jgi:hypothetical protein